MNSHFISFRFIHLLKQNESKFANAYSLRLQYLIKIIIYQKLVLLSDDIDQLILVDDN